MEYQYRQFCPNNPNYRPPRPNNHYNHHSTNQDPQYFQAQHHRPRPHRNFYNNSNQQDRNFQNGAQGQGQRMNFYGGGNGGRGFHQQRQPYPNQNQRANQNHNAGQQPRGKGSLYYCDTCDKSCGDQGSLEEHKAEHITCKLDGCTFTAHPKIILKHITMQHSTNLFFRVKGYDSPEAYNKWRQERKENFPTKENIAKKSSQKKEKDLRGERLTGKRKVPTLPIFRHPIATEHSSRGNYVHNRNKIRSALNRQRNPRPVPTSSFNERPMSTGKNKSEVVFLENYYSHVGVNSKGKLVGKKLTVWKTKSVEEVEEGSDSDDCAKGNGTTGGVAITDDEEDVVGRAFEAHVLPAVALDPSADPKDMRAGINSGPLGLVAYSSDSDLEDGELKDEDEREEVIHPPISCSPSRGLVAAAIANQITPMTTIPPQLRTITVNSDSAPYAKKPRKNMEGLFQKRQEKKRQRQEAVKANKKGDHNQAPCNPGRTKLAHPAKRRPPAVVRKPTLLRRLLNDEISKERNCILQVCRFIVKNNFFDEASSSKTIETKKKQTPSSLN